MAARLHGPSTESIPKRALSQELARVRHWLPLSIMLLVFVTILWDQSRWRLSVFAPLFFIYFTFILPVPTIANLLGVAILMWWARYDSYRMLVLYGISGLIVYIFLLPFRDDIQAIIRRRTPDVPWMVWTIVGWSVAYAIDKLEYAAKTVIGISDAALHAYTKYKEDPDSAQDRSQFVLDRLNSLTKASKDAVRSTMASFTRGPSSDSDTAVPEEQPMPKKRGRPVGSRNKKREMDDGSLRMTPPPTGVKPIKRSGSRAPSLPPAMDITPERRYLRANRQADINAGKNPEPYLDLADAREANAEAAVKPEEDEPSPTKGRRAKKIEPADVEDAGTVKTRRKRDVS